MLPSFSFVSTFVATFIIATALSMATGCSTSSKNPGGPLEVATDHPSVINARAEPEIVTLNRDLQPNQQAEVLADVKDFKGQISGVVLKFRDIPLELPLENIGGTTWRAEFSPHELQSLAVSGRTVQYKADIIAKDDKGETARSPDAVNVTIQAPDLGHGIG